MMQLLADTSGRAVHVPGVERDPGARRGAVRRRRRRRVRDIGARDRGDAAGAARTYTPDPEAKRIYDDVYAIYRSAVRHARPHARLELLHDLKRIRNRKESRLNRAAPHRPARDHAGALRRHDPGDHRAPGRLRGAVARSWLATVADVVFTRPARNRDDVEAIAASWWRPASTGSRS